MEKNCKDEIMNFEKGATRVLRSSLKSKYEQSPGKDVKRMKTSHKGKSILPGESRKSPRNETFKNKEVGDANVCSGKTETAWTVKSKQEFTISAPGDTSVCWISGFSLLPSGVIVLADFFNHKLKKLDSEYTLVSFCDLSAPAIGMCYIGNDSVVVSLGKKLQFADVVGDIKLTNLVEIDIYCKGLTYHDDNIYIVDEKTVSIYTREGSLVRELYRHNGHAYFQSIAVSNNGRRIYIASSNVGLVTIDDSGNHLHTLYEEYLKAPFGICLDDKSNVFICLAWLGRVIEVNSEGRQVLGDLVKKSDLDLEPCSVYFERMTPSLIVACGKSNKLYIFKLEVS